MVKAKFDLKDDSVVVVVGSGAGGGTLGNELAQRGVKTVILEAGGRHEIQDFSNDEWGMFGSHWVDEVLDCIPWPFGEITWRAFNSDYGFIRGCVVCSECVCVAKGLSGM